MILAQVDYVPALDPVGLPAEAGWFTFLMLLTLFLHFLFMNFVLGGNLLAVGLNVAALLGRSEANRSANIIYQAMPPAISMAITMGVAPLLFVQVLYGQYFYSANVLLGLAWFSFVVVLLGGFYLAYWLTYRGSNALQKRKGWWDDRPGRRLLISLPVVACFLWIAWMFTNNHELSIHPNLWADQGAWRSPRLYVPAHTTILRYAHNLIGMTAVAALCVAGIGWWRKWRVLDSPDTSSRLIRFGLMTGGVLLSLQVTIGLAFFIVILLKYEPVGKQIMGFKTALGGVWTVALLPAILAPMAVFMAAVRPASFRRFLLAVAIAVLVLVGMLIGREEVRRSFMALPDGGAFSMDQWKVYPQPVSLLVFAALLVVGLAVVAMMLWWMIRMPPRELTGNPVPRPEDQPSLSASAQAATSSDSDAL